MADICQSCGMPLKQDPDGGGRNADGSVSRKYCSYCYQDGKFLNEDMNAREMQIFCIGKLKEMKVPGPLAWLMTRNIPKLERWR